MPDLLLIKNGTIYDPANGVDGVVRDLWIADGKLIAAPLDENMRPTRTLDATGLVVMPGGIDMHCHIAGPKVNAGRAMSGERRVSSGELNDEQRAAKATFQASSLKSHTSSPQPQVPRPTPHPSPLTPSCGVPTTTITGYKYAGLGYTTAFDAAIAPMAARHAHLELADTPCIDKGCFLLVGDHHYLLRAIADQEPQRVRTFLAWLMARGRGYAPKLVNPGGVERWKQHRAGSPIDLDTVIDGFGISPRDILRETTAAANDIGLSHPVHIHCNNLGLPGNWTTTLETMRLLEGRKAHLTHIQFHSYGGGEADESSFNSRVQPLVDYFNTHENISVDVGQILFGPTTSMTGDSAAGYYLSQLYKTRWYSHDVELESGCGVSPIEYKQKSVVNAWQWAIGLEWFLLAVDPWRIALSTDHPNGGSFTSYPHIIRLLMDAAYRRELVKQLPKRVREQTVLRTIEREYTLREICIITRAAPARLLGLAQKGHLGAGADADLTLYVPHADKEQMFQLPRYVIKAGAFLIDDYELREALASTGTHAAALGRTLSVSPEYDVADEAHIADWINQHSTVRYENYARP